MNESPQTLAVDYFIDIMRTAAEKGIVPPALKFTSADRYANAERVFLYASEYKPSGRILQVNFFCSERKVSGAKFFGLIIVQEFKELEEEIDMEISEYRRKSFKKISRQQRHREETTR